jgi:hypothetical protein
MNTVTKLIIAIAAVSAYRLYVRLKTIRTF